MKNVKALAVMLVFFSFVVLVGACTSGSRPVTITFLMLGNRPTNGRADAALAELNKITAERIGAVLRLRYVEWADWQNQYQLSLASQDPSFDLVTTATDWLYGWEIARRGGFYPLTPELLQEHAPLSWESIPAAHWDLCTKDGYIWFIPEDQYTQFTNHGMFWRRDWARAGGLEEINRFEDLEIYFDIVKETQPQAFPWDVSGNYLTLGLIGAYMQAKRAVQPILGIAAGNYHIFEYDAGDPYTVLSLSMDGDEIFEAARILDRWSKKGFWREDVLNHMTDTGNLFMAGLSGAQQHHTNTFIQLREQMDREQPGSEIQMYWFGKEINNVNRDLKTHAAIAVNGASRNVEKALQMYDLIRNDREIYLLYNYGIEGIDYIVHPDGTFGWPPGYNELTDGLGTNFWGGRVDKFEPVWDNWWAGRQDFIDHLDSFARDYPLEKFVFDNTRVSAELAALGDVCITHLPAIHYGKTNDPDRAVVDFRAALRRAGYDRVIAEIQRQLDAFKAELNH